MHHKVLIRDWMTSKPFTAYEDMSLMGAYERMQEHDIRRLPVVVGEKLIGIITRSDIQQLIAWTQDQIFALAGRTVSEVMTRNPAAVDHNQTVRDAAMKMRELHISGMPVVNGDRLVGIITESDIFRMVVNEWSALEND